MLAIQATRVFDGARLIPGGAVILLRDGSIEAVDQRSNTPPAGYDVSAFDNATVLPGLIDMHVHLCCDNSVGAVESLGSASDEHVAATIEESIGMQLRAGVTTVRDLGDRSWTVVERRDRTRPDMAPIAPTILASGPPITTMSGHCASWGGEADGMAGLSEAVATRAERGVDVVKIMASGGVNTFETDPSRSQFTEEELRLVVDKAHQAGLPVTAHAHAREAVERSIAAGVDGIEHCTCLTSDGPRMDDQLLDLLASRGVFVCPTLGRIPSSVIPPGVAERFRAIGLEPGEHAKRIGRAHRAGVKIVTGMDAGIAPGKCHGSLAYSIAALVDGGVSTSDAIASATSEAAAALGLGKRKGWLRSGYDADLIVVDGDPVSDVSALTRVLAVFVGGNRLALAETRADQATS
jgi:imidazolonepropionase-like amidohydrolase